MGGVSRPETSAVPTDGATPSAESEEPPSGLPPDEPEETPLGVPVEADDGPEEEPGPDAMPGIPTEGDPPAVG